MFLICAGTRRQALGLGWVGGTALRSGVRGGGWRCGWCARGRPALSRSTIREVLRVGDMMVDGVIPLGEALRPLGL